MRKGKNREISFPEIASLGEIRNSKIALTIWSGENSLFWNHIRSPPRSNYGRRHFLSFSKGGCHEKDDSFRSATDFLYRYLSM
jgi:hypothetical protein